jgi:hypothetical protein
LKDKKTLEAYVHKHVFPRIGEFERHYLTQYFTVLFSDGFETNDLSAWTTVTGNIATSTLHPNEGTYSAYLDGSGANWCRETLGSTYTELHLRAYFYFTVSPTTGNYSNILTLQDSTGTVTLEGWVYIVGGVSHFGIYVNGNIVDSGITVQTGQEYCIEIAMLNAVSGWGKMWINDVLKCEYDYNTSANNPYKYLVLGAFNRTGDAYTAYGDSVVAADVYIGPISGVTNVSVADSLAASDAVLRNKALIVADSLGAVDAFGLGNKTLRIADSIGVVDPYGLFDPAIFDPAIFDTTAMFNLYVNKTLKFADSVGALDSVLGNKSLIVSDVVSLSELINVVTGAIIKTVADVIGISDIALINKTAVIADAVSVLDQVFRHKPSVAVADVVAVAEAVLVSKLLMVADSSLLSDSVYRNKPSLAIGDSIGLADALLRNKTFAVADSVSLADVFNILKTLKVSDVLSLVDAVSTPSRVLQALDAVGLADNAFVNKALLVTDNVSLVEVVWAGIRRETALYLVVGNLVVNLRTGKVDFAL